ncbi:EAL domain-containing protein [Lysobacter yangpyeongensis]|uniref:EAL domain-containing protein n=1 Tax=Lysobacter yangpyeongensis TaxID=346182 RepID=A0ABW0SK05_9GAMM
MSTYYDPHSGIPVDPVTSLYRLGAGGPSLPAGLAAAGATGRKVALLHIDIDRFGAINESMGPMMGDQVLATIAHRLSKAMPAGGWLWRLGSDEFLAGIGYRHEEPDGVALAERLRDAFDAPLSIPPYVLRVNLAIGIAVYPEDAQDAAGLLAQAEQAVRLAKREGRNGVGMSSLPDAPAQTPETVSRTVVDAMANNEFTLFYQPTANAQDGSIDAVSVLLRWQTPMHGMLRPSSFLDLIERSGLSARVDYWVVNRALAQLAKWRDEGMDYLNIAVHLANPMLLRPDCVDLIGQMLHKFQIPAQAVEFEISESVLALDARNVADTLAGLRALGATLTVRDFGMGGLGLAALAQYPLDRLKIDRSLIHNVASDPRAAAIVRGIIALGHRLGMKVTAKGVETEAELNFLRRNHCDFFLGHLFSPPRPAEDIGDLIRRRFLLPEAFATTRPERTLLLLDDETNVLNSLVRLFRRDGYRLLTAASVREAFDLLASNTVQVIVSDQRMPDMNGTEFLERVRDLYPDTMRMVLSGYTDLAMITDAINRGAIYRFLTKPWNDDELREHIRDAFRAHERTSTYEESF